MNHKDVTSGLFWMGVGIAFCAGAYKFRLIKSGIPGAGFFPFLAGIIMVFLALVVLASALKKKTTQGTLSGEKFFPRKNSPKKLGLALTGLLGYWLLLETLGYLGTTFLFLVFLLKFIEPQRWTTVLTTAILATGLSYLLFNLWLKVQMPIGILGFGF